MRSIASLPLAVVAKFEFPKGLFERAGLMRFAISASFLKSVCLRVAVVAKFEFPKGLFERAGLMRLAMSASFLKSVCLRVFVKAA